MTWWALCDSFLMFMDISSSSSVRILHALIVHVNTKRKNYCAKNCPNKWGPNLFLQKIPCQKGSSSCANVEKKFKSTCWGKHCILLNVYYIYLIFPFACHKMFFKFLWKIRRLTMIITNAWGKIGHTRSRNQL